MPLIELIGIEPVRDAEDNLVGTRTWVRDRDAPLGRRLELRPGDYDGPVLIDGLGRAHPAE